MKIARTLYASSIACALLAPTLVFASHDVPWNGPKTREQVRHELDEARKDGSLPFLQRSQPAPGKNYGTANSRDQVVADLNAARADGTLDQIRRSQSIPVKATGPARTRDEVRAEVMNLSPDDRYRLHRMNVN